MTLWAWVLIAFLAGALVGAGVVWWFARRRPREVELRRLRTVLDRYHGDVAHHFQEAGDLITRLRGDIEQLYAHLERGAAHLTTEEAVQRRLREMGPGDEAARELGHGEADGPTTPGR